LVFLTGNNLQHFFFERSRTHCGRADARRYSYTRVCDRRGRGEICAAAQRLGTT
jgi:hypothetical protein